MSTEVTNTIKFKKLAKKNCLLHFRHYNNYRVIAFSQSKIYTNADLKPRNTTHYQFEF